ncbi:hypothetical protein ACFWVU_21300 [Streptomyces sp. NPDC058686]|uniref:hypothetical protein n=1 Tax=Streptomyces sp. NPDC058686 TaxID=3346599 RepID=UPI0036682EF3
MMWEGIGRVVRVGGEGDELPETEPEFRADGGPGAMDLHPAPAPDVVAGTNADATAGINADADAETGAEARQPAVRPRRRLLLGTTVASVLLALVGGVLLYQAHELRSTPAAANRALTDVEATTRVGGDVGSALAKVFSYAPGGTDATERSAREVLSGRAAHQYEQLFAQVKDNVRTQRVTLTTQAVRIGTVSLRGDTAHLLVFLDQTARRGGGKPTTSAAQLSVTARLRGDVWLIVDIKAR